MKGLQKLRKATAIPCCSLARILGVPKIRSNMNVLHFRAAVRGNIRTSEAPAKEEIHAHSFDRKIYSLICRIEACTQQNHMTSIILRQPRYVQEKSENHETLSTCWFGFLLIPQHRLQKPLPVSPLKPAFDRR